MTKGKTRKRKQGYDLAKLIDKIEKATSTAMKIYRVLEPIAKVIGKNRGKTK
jgi:hypothetical protein